MSLTLAQRKELLMEMSLACYTIGSLATVYELKKSINYGRQHDEDVQPKMLWARSIREELP